MSNFLISMLKFDTNGLSTVTVTVTDTAYYNNIIAQRERERERKREREKARERGGRRVRREGEEGEFD